MNSKLINYINRNYDTVTAKQVNLIEDKEEEARIDVSQLQIKC